MIDRQFTEIERPMNVSVIIPAYKAGHTISRAVESVLAQTHPATEILIVDDGSPDDITEALVPYGDRVTLLRKENGGAASARNLGIDTASGDLVAFLDADDYWEPAKLERHVALYEQHPQLGLTCGRYFNEEPGERRELVSLKGVELDQVARPEGPEAFEWATRTSTITVVVRREVLGDERFDTELETAEDRDLWVRLICKAPVYCLSEPLATAVLEPGSLSRSNVDRDCGNMLKVVHRHQELLGKAELKRQETTVYRRWASGHLGGSRPRNAIQPALQRLKRTPFSAEGWWVLGKSFAWSIAQRLTLPPKSHIAKCEISDAVR